MRQIFKLWLAVGLVGLLLLGGCAIPRVKAEDRLFLRVSVDYLDEYRLPQQDFEGTTVGGLSAIAYSPQTNQLYALSDDRGRLGPPRFYTLTLGLTSDSAGTPAFESLAVDSFTELTDPEGQSYGVGQLDPEGMALSPRQTVLISSEGDASQGVAPLIGEFDLATGQMQAAFRLPERYLPNDETPPSQGIQNNLSLESLTVSLGQPSNALIEPFRVFTATESALVQDYDDDPARSLNNRFLHYLIGESQSTVIAEHRYPLDLEPQGALLNGLTELLTLDQGGHFLALERAFGLRGFQVKLFQLATGGATDISRVASLKGDVEGIQPIRKQLVLDLTAAGIAAENLEGMTLGPRLPDGSQSLLMVSDNNFEESQETQFLLFRLKVG
ncbi:esterase-like activity of phytase family protein [Pseudanabaena sp. FACHB-2040]|uniref:esterase-like activity of phytase family protein n=1 Tax=Pseudanabaena sp. FACHB-2040 TaxID=2692859 RepID=UPI001682ADA9|nr:esterase-like activity of phytase family protein [Pseudanabaena sp. FACHB-2040]MBD2257666.1 esterase-like activity of phytase family protein [Pseudanabaena sp. FACHB-2040]